MDTEPATEPDAELDLELDLELGQALDRLLERRVRVLLAKSLNIEQQLKLVTAGVNLVTAQTRMKPGPEADSGAFFKGNGNAAKSP